MLNLLQQFLIIESNTGKCATRIRCKRFTSEIVTALLIVSPARKYPFPFFICPGRGCRRYETVFLGNEIRRATFQCEIEIAKERPLVGILRFYEIIALIRIIESFFSR